MVVVWLPGMPEKGGKKFKKANGYHGSQLNDCGGKRARGIIGAGVKVYRMSLEKLQGEPKGDWKKAVGGDDPGRNNDEAGLDQREAEDGNAGRRVPCREAGAEKWRSDRKMAAVRRGVMSILLTLAK